MSQDNQNWISPLAEGAAAMHEIFIAYVRAGFRREEALQIVIALLQGATMQQQQQAPPDD